jgi:hypothetical protein
MNVQTCLVGEKRDTGHKAKCLNRLENRIFKTPARYLIEVREDELTGDGVAAFNFLPIGNSSELGLALVTNKSFAKKMSYAHKKTMRFSLSYRKAYGRPSCLEDYLRVRRRSRTQEVFGKCTECSPCSLLELERRNEALTASERFCNRWRWLNDHLRVEK